MVNHNYTITILLLFLSVFLFLCQTTIVHSQNTTITNVDESNQTDNLTLDITSDYYNYGIGQEVKISGILKNETGLPEDGKVILILSCESSPTKTTNMFQEILRVYETIIYEFFPSCKSQQTLDYETIYTQNGTFNVNFTESSTSGDYLINATLIPSKNISDIERIKIVNYFTYFPFMIPFTITLFSVIGLLITLFFTGFAKKAPNVFRTLRFIFISGIALSPILLLIITEVGVGINSPIGLIMQPENKNSFQLNDQQLSQWMIHIGGLQKNNYSNGISFPFYVVAFGLLGGYLRYLYKMYEKGDEFVLDPGRQKQVEETEKTHFLQYTLAELAEILIAPLLAIAVYFILFQANPYTDPYIAAAISFTLGLITKEVINSLVNFAKGRTGGIKQADDASSSKQADDASSSKQRYRDTTSKQPVKN